MLVMSTSKVFVDCLLTLDAPQQTFYRLIFATTCPLILLILTL